MAPNTTSTISEGKEGGKSRAISALASFDFLPDTAHVRLPIVIALTGTSANTVWRWVREGRLPKPYKLGPQVSAWKVGELRDYLRKIERPA